MEIKRTLSPQWETAKVLLDTFSSVTFFLLLCSGEEILFLTKCDDFVALRSEGFLACFYQIWVGGVCRKERTLHGRLACYHGFC